MTPSFLALGGSWGSEVSFEGRKGELLKGRTGSTRRSKRTQSLREQWQGGVSSLETERALSPKGKSWAPKRPPQAAST